MNYKKLFLFIILGILLHSCNALPYIFGFGTGAIDDSSKKALRTLGIGFAAAGVAEYAIDKHREKQREKEEDSYNLGRANAAIEYQNKLRDKERRDKAYWEKISPRKHRYIIKLPKERDGILYDETKKVLEVIK